MRIAPNCMWIVAALLSASVFADEPASAVRTAGHGDLEKVSRLLVFSASRKVPVQVPGQVSTGDTLTLQYRFDGKAVREQFTVADISIRGDLCCLHNQRRTQGDAAPGDTIYVSPCGRIR